MTKLLDHIRVLDLSTARGELAGRVFADLGAEVIKVEPPAGCEARSLPPFANGNRADSLFWAAGGLGKRSVVLDIESDADRSRLLDLVPTADVFIESSTPGEMAARGLGYEQLSALNPGLVYLSVTPYGQDGPDATSLATDLTVEAAAGQVNLMGDGDRPPLPIGYPQAAFHGSTLGAADALVALHERERSGLGQHVDTSMQAAVIWTLLTANGFPTYTGGDPPRTGEGRNTPPQEMVPGVSIPRSAECADGWVVFTLVLGDAGARSFAALMAWADAEGHLSAELRAVNWLTWAEDLRAGTLSAELANGGLDAMRSLLKTKEKRELMDRAVSDRLLLAPIYNAADLRVDPQLVARDYWQEVDGRTYPGPFAKFSHTPIEYERPAPALGADQHLLDTPRQSFAPPSSHATARRGAFEGVKVADFAWVGAGPLVSKVLADHGATVIHVESERKIDYLRLIPPFRGGTPGVNTNFSGPNFNSSKYGLAINLGAPEGLELARRLADWSDVVVESFTPGVMGRLGLGYEELSRSHPELVMLSSCMRGQTGPERSYTAFGAQGGAVAGFEAITGWPDRAPSGIWGAYTDFVSPRYATAALVAAMLHRDRTGQGQYIDLSQAEAALHYIEPLLLDYAVNGRVAGLVGHDSLYAAPHGVYPAQGIERYLAIAVETDDQWRSLIAATGITGVNGSESLARRRSLRPAIDAALQEWCLARDPFEAAALLKAAGVPASVALRPTDLHKDAQLAHRNFFVTLEHTEQGPSVFEGLASHFSGSPTGPHRAGPCLGEHTYQVLEEHLQLTAEEIERYAIAGALT